MQVTADYRLTSSNALSMTFSATTDKATIVNLCNHAYWNLSGDLKTDIKDHVRARITPKSLRVLFVVLPWCKRDAMHPLHLRC